MCAPGKVFDNFYKSMVYYSEECESSRRSGCCPSGPRSLIWVINCVLNKSDQPTPNHGIKSTDKSYVYYIHAMKKTKKEETIITFNNKIRWKQWHLSSMTMRCEVILLVWLMMWLLDTPLLFSLADFGNAYQSPFSQHQPWKQIF